MVWLYLRPNSYKENYLHGLMYLFLFNLPKPAVEYLAHKWTVLKIKDMLADVIITQQNDIDLRVIAPTVKRTLDPIKADDNEPAAKKSKSEIIDE